MAAYLNAGGSITDFQKHSVVAAGWGGLVAGYETDVIGAELGDITTELLIDAIQLTHPDRHPSERRALAQRVTAELLALQPFTFPAPRPAAHAPPATTEPTVTANNNGAHSTTTQPLRSTYPCADCADAIPYDYCTACRTEWTRRFRAQAQQENAKRRAWYQRRKLAKRRAAPPRFCLQCHRGIAATRRTDVQYCSEKCRVMAHRRRR
jgi:hypothetical protein